MMGKILADDVGLGWIVTQAGQVLVGALKKWHFDMSDVHASKSNEQITQIWALVQSLWPRVGS